MNEAKPSVLVAGPAHMPLCVWLERAQGSVKKVFILFLANASYLLIPAVSEISVWHSTNFSPEGVGF